MRIQEAMVQLLLKQPFYGYIAASVVPRESSSVTTTKMITDPSLVLLYNKEWYETLKKEHAFGVVIHELLHLILMHSFRKGNRENHLWVIACDMAANEYIDAGLLPEDSVTVGRISKDIREKIPKGKSAELYYDIITKAENQISFLSKDSEIKIALRDGQQLTANNSVEGDSSEVNKNAFISMFSDVIAQAATEGEVPEGIPGVIEDIYKTGEINWRNVLKRFLSGKGKMIVRKTYKRESKRYEGLPGNKRTTGVTALLAIDESGSISSSQASYFYREMLNIKRITNAELIVTEFDTSCSEPVPIERYIREKKRMKNGGTDFRPVFKLADNLRIPLVIILTDGEGRAPTNCNQQVLWVLTKSGKKPAEFGHCITLEAQGG